MKTINNDQLEIALNILKEQARKQGVSTMQLKGNDTLFIFSKEKIKNLLDNMEQSKTDVGMMIVSLTPNADPLTVN